jgi:hypothetical protein
VLRYSPKISRISHALYIVPTTILLVNLLVVAAPAATVNISAGQSIQNAVNSNPGGTTFQIAAGTYRQQSIVPKAGDVFIGAAGADLNGATLVTGFTKNTFWVAHINVSYPASLPGQCFGWAPMCAYPEDLYVDNNLYQRVGSLSAMSSHHWYLDYSNGNVYLMDDPSGQYVEVTTTRYAFWGNANNVTIRGLVIEKYANPGQTGAIEPMNAALAQGSNWIVEDNEIRYNHAAGVEGTTGMQILRNRIHNNGELGIAACGDNILVGNNTINYNNTVGYNFGFGAGGAKFDKTNNLVVRYNTVSGNYGAGLHSDSYSYNTLYEYNNTSNNKVAGILYEISSYGVIRYNTISNDGYNPQGSGPWWGAGIYNLNSTNVEVYNNTLTNCMHGITGANSLRADVNGIIFQVDNYSVHDNVITQSTGVAAGVFTLLSGDLIYTSWGNRYSANTYKLPSGGLNYYWMGKYLNLASWKNYGED